MKTGTVGYARSGSTLKTVVINNVGSGGTAGIYVINATSGGGSGAQITVMVGSGGTLSSVTVTNGGYGYTYPPTFDVDTPTGGSAMAVYGQLGPLSMNIVTSADIALQPGSNAGIGAVHPIVFLNSITPGNYGFVQELGVATVLSYGSVAQSLDQFAIVESSTNSDGLMAASSATYGIYAIGVVIDPLTSAAAAGTKFRILLDGPVVQD